MSKIFFTSDLHLCHDREFIYKPRGFNSIQEHDETIVKNWNEDASNEDTIYVLGDLMLNDNERALEYLQQLNGNIKIIAGNHDTSARIKLYESLDNVEFLGFADRFKYNKYNFYLSHYPTMTSNLEGSIHLREHIINLFGHTHQTTNFYNDMPFMYHVGLDSHNCHLVLIDDAIEDMKAEVKVCLDMLQKSAAADPVATLRPCAPTIPAAARCNKCVYTFGLCGQDDAHGTCPLYKRDPPDGGYYG